MYLWLFLFPALCYCIFYYKRRNLYKHASSVINHKSDLPIIGVSWVFLGSTEEILEKLKDYSTFTSNNGGIMHGWFGPLLYYLISDPVKIEVILKNNLEKDISSLFLRALVGQASIFAPVSVWKPRRKISTSAFSPKILASFVKIFAEQSDELTKRLATQAGKGEFKIWPFINAYSLAAILESAMGVKLELQDDFNNSILTAVNTSFHLISERLFRLWFWPDCLYKLCGDEAKLKHYTKIINDFADEVIQQKKLQRQKQKPDIMETYGDKTLLDLLMSFPGGVKGYTDIELREEVVTFLLASTDTSAVAMGFTLKLLGKYPEVQEKVYKEMQAVFGDSDRQLEKDDLPNLQYLERVIKETLRLYPPAPFITREADKDTPLPGDIILPKGAGLFVSIWGVHRNKTVWGADADYFDPDRFLPERINGIHPCAFIPFSYGPRNCLGYQYAMMSIKTALSTVLRRYKVICAPEPTREPNMRIKFDIMLKAVDGHQIALEFRKK